MSDATFCLVPRAAIIASGDSDDFHHVSDDEVVLVAVEALEQARRERDEWQEWHHVAVRERDRLAVDALAVLAGAGIATPEKGYVAEPWALAGDIARLAKERDEARADYERARADYARCAETQRAAFADAAKAEADAARLREALVESREAQHKASLERDAHHREEVVLRAEVERLEAALEKVVRNADRPGDMFSIASAALGEVEP